MQLKKGFLKSLFSQHFILLKSILKKKPLLFTPGNMLLKPSKTPQKWADSIPKSDVLAPKIAK